MNKIRFGEGLNVYPVLAPQNITATATVTSFVDLAMAHWCTFAVQFGTVTCTDTGVITIGVEGSTSGADSDTEANVGYYYRFSHAIAGAPSLSAITSVDSTSTTTISSTDLTNKVLLVSVDPQLVGNAGYRYVRFTIDGAADVSALNLGVVAYTSPRFPGSSPAYTFTST